MTRHEPRALRRRMTPSRKAVGTAGLYVLAASVALVMVVPIAWAFSAGFRPVDEIFKYVYPLSWKTFLPVHFTTENISRLLFAEGSPWPRYILNSFIYGIVVVAVGGLVNSLAGYAFARLRFPGRDVIFIVALSTMIIPFEATALPLYLIVRTIGWIDTYQALIVPSLANAFNIFLLRQFFLSIPRELEEAAIIDGAGPLGVFFRVVVPISWPVIITTCIISFQAAWDAFFWPLIATSSPEVRVIQVGVSQLATRDVTYWDLTFAAVAIAAAVPILVFIIFQRFYTRGISTTGIKG